MIDKDEEKPQTAPIEKTRTEKPAPLPKVEEKPAPLPK